jgi:tRNA pseudouridine32 synthase/23S rRNA pseudouridine746 synthase
MTASSYHPPVGQALRFLHVSAQLLIVDKPAGLLTVPGRGADKADCLLSRVQMSFPDAMIVHRLDMDTSGIVVMGRGPQPQRALSMLFQARRVDKRYQALVDGTWSRPSAGEIDLPIAADWPNRPRQKVDTVAGRHCLTRYRLMHADPATAVSRVELVPVTGRSHQLRVHMESAGHPILGDRFYGTETSLARASRLMLHACAIEFADPASGEMIKVTSTPPF